MTFQASSIINFGEWLPDLPFYENPGLVEALNVIPIDKHYKDFLALTTTGNAIASRVVAGFGALDTGGVAWLYAATLTDIYQATAGAWQDLSAATFNTASNGYWRFAQFDTLVIATNYADTVQCVTAGAASLTALGTSGTAPRARQIGVIGRFVMLGDTDVIGGTVPHRVQWCGIDNPRDWQTPNTAAARAVQAGAQTLNLASGAVTAISGGQFYGLVFQSRGITRFTYIGGDEVFQVQTIEKSHGCWFPQSMVQVGEMVYFIAHDGFYVTDGQSVRPIGNAKVDKTFLALVDQGFRERVTGAVDFQTKCIFWSFPDFDATSGAPDKLLIYNYAEDRFSNSNQEMEVLFNAYTSGYTLDQLDSLYTSIDAMTITFDSATFQGGLPTMYGFSTAHKLGTFGGASQDATFETGEYDMNPAGRFFVRGVRPMVTGSPTTLTVQVGTRDNQDSATRTFTAAVSRTSRTGMADFRQQVKYGTVRVNVAGGFDRAIGFNMDGVKGNQV